MSVWKARSSSEPISRSPNPSDRSTTASALGLRCSWPMTQIITSGHSDVTRSRNGGTGPGKSDTRRAAVPARRGECWTESLNDVRSTRSGGGAGCILRGLGKARAVALLLPWTGQPTFAVVACTAVAPCDHHPRRPATKGTTTSNGRTRALRRHPLNRSGDRPDSANPPAASGRRLLAEYHRGIDRSDTDHTSSTRRVLAR